MADSFPVCSLTHPQALLWSQALRLAVTCSHSCTYSYCVPILHSNRVCRIAFPSAVELPAWLRALVSICLWSHDAHMTFVAMATLLKLLEQFWLWSLVPRGPPMTREGGGLSSVSLDEGPPPLMPASIVTLLVAKSSYVRVSDVHHLMMHVHVRT